MIIGFSGHQNLGTPETQEWLQVAILKELEARSVSVGISCLAGGGDQLFSQIIIDLGKELQAVIPCSGYEATFSKKEDADHYRLLLSLAKRQHYQRFDSPSEQAFYDAGKMVVDLSNMMFFAWNGKPAQGLGGTADIVTYAGDKSVPIVHFNITTRRVLV